MDETLSPEELEQLEKLVDEAVAFVGDLLSKEKKVALDTALEIGSYILDRFYEGSEDRYRDHSHGTPALHALIDKLELGSHTISLRHLHNYVVAAIQDRHWDAHIKAGRMDKDVEKVQLTSRLHLAKCRKVLDEIRIAERVVKEGLSTRRVEELVRDANDIERGVQQRERDPEAIIATVTVKRALDELEESGWEDLSSEQLGWFWRDLGEKIQRLVRFQIQVEAALRSRGAWNQRKVVPGGPSASEFNAIIADVLVGEHPDLMIPPRTTSQVMAALGAHGAHVLEDLEDAPIEDARAWYQGFSQQVVEVFGVQEPSQDSLSDEVPAQQRPTTRDEPAAWLSRGRKLVADVEALPVHDRFPSLRQHLDIVMEALEPPEPDDDGEDDSDDGRDTDWGTEDPETGRFEEDGADGAETTCWQPDFVEGDVLADDDYQSEGAGAPSAALEECPPVYVNDESANLVDDDLVDDDGLGTPGFHDDEEHPYGPDAETDTALAERVEIHCFGRILPFRSSDVAVVFGLSHQRVTSILRRKNWPRGDTILEDHSYGWRWFPQNFDPECAESMDPPYHWSELEIDDQMNTWDKHGPTPDKMKRFRRPPRRWR